MDDLIGVYLVQPFQVTDYRNLPFHVLLHVNIGDDNVTVLSYTV